MAKAKNSEPLPYFKWLWRDWRANRKVQRLHYVARGLYRDLLDEQWCEGFIPDDVELLADICSCPVEVMSEHWPSLRQFFEECESGLNNLKLEQLRTEDDATRAAKARGGRNSAASKLNAKQDKSTGLEEVLKTSEDQFKISETDDKTSYIAEQSRAETEQKQSIEQEAEPDSLSLETDGQGGVMKIKNEIQAVCAGYGVKPGGFKNTWDDVKALGVGHSVGAVVRDFTSWLNENRGDDFPSGAVPKYLRVAHERLSADSQTSAEINDPEVASLARQITRASGGEIAFLDKQKVRLSAALKEFTLDEILAGFKEWFSKQDVAKDGPFLAGKYAQQAADLAYNVREDRLDREHAQAARDAKALQMQEEAEADRKKAEAVRAEQESFDPLADLV